MFAGGILLLSDHFPKVMKYDTLYVIRSETSHILYQGEKFTRTEMLKQKSITEINKFVKNLKNNNNLYGQR